jgi:hypothetical protein
MKQSDVHRYRLRAVECGQRAVTSPNDNERARWHELERVWLELAVRVEADEKLGLHQAPSKSH